MTIKKISIASCRQCPKYSTGGGFGAVAYIPSCSELGRNLKYTTGTGYRGRMIVATVVPGIDPDCPLADDTDDSADLGVWSELLRLGIERRLIPGCDIVTTISDNPETGGDILIQIDLGDTLVAEFKAWGKDVAADPPGYRAHVEELLARQYADHLQTLANNAAINEIPD